MSAKYRTQYGEVNINEDVLAIIAGLATTECYGLVGMASRSAKDGIKELMKKESFVKGVKVVADGDEITVELNIIVEFGTNISAVADNIISKVKYTIETMTGLKVKKIDINVQGIRM